MFVFLLKMFSRSSGWADVEPLLAFFLGAALLAVLLTAFFSRPVSGEPPSPGLAWNLYRLLLRAGWAVSLVALVAAAGAVLYSYVNHAVASFERTHGRVTQANFDAVQTIWGPEQVQGELTVDIYHDEEITERIESEDLSKPVILHKKTIKVPATGNPYLSEKHEVTLLQNPRQKGSAYYDGYETDNSFNWKLRNPADVVEKCVLTFPLPAAQAMYDGLAATLDGQDVLPQMEIRDGNLCLTLDVQPSATMDMHIGFKSRGLSYWYFQISQSREIRDFTLTLNLPDLPQRLLNYPGGCMTPSNLQPLNGGQGTALTYRLDHALSNKGMGIALPQLPQPGATTRAVLQEAGRAWLLAFALLLFGLTLSGVRHAEVLAVLFGAAAALSYGLLAEFSDLLFGFWGTAVFVLVPMFLFLAWLLKRVGRRAGVMLAAGLLLFGLLYPCLAGLDPIRQPLYLDLGCLCLLAACTWLLKGKLAFVSTAAINPIGVPTASPSQA